MLIPLVLEKLPADIRLEISRSLGKESCNIAEFMVIVKNEVVARESCSFIKTNTRHVHHESKDNNENITHHTTEALFTNQDRILKCAISGAAAHR